MPWISRNSTFFLTILQLYCLGHYLYMWDVRWRTLESSPRLTIMKKKEDMLHITSGSDSHSSSRFSTSIIHSILHSILFYIFYITEHPILYIYILQSILFYIFCSTKYPILYILYYRASYSIYLYYRASYSIYVLLQRFLFYIFIL